MRLQAADDKRTLHLGDAGQRAGPGARRAAPCREHEGQRAARLGAGAQEGVCDGV
jgi:hypothetical protein